MDRVNTQLVALAAQLREIFGADLVGMYLHGSLALGCFNPSRSDIDLLAVTRADLTPGSRDSVIRTLLTLSGNPAPIEISILKQVDLHPWRHPCPYIFHYSESWRQALSGGAFSAPQSQGDPDLAGHITVLRARGQALYGAPITEVFPEVPRADFLDSILADVLSPEFGLTGATISPVYMALNACRTLAYLQGGEVLSKAEGGQWALDHLPAEFRPVVAAALVAYQTEGEIPRDSALNSLQTWFLMAIKASV